MPTTADPNMHFACTQLDMAPAGPGSLAALLLLVAMCGAADGAAQGALFGEAAALDPAFTPALVAGTAVSGVVVSLLRIATKAALPATPAGLRASASLYFTIAALICLACVWVHFKLLPGLLLTTLDAPLSHRSKAAAHTALRGQQSGAELGAEGGGGSGGAAEDERATLVDRHHGDSLDSFSADLPPALRIENAASAPPSYLEVAWQVRGYAASLVLVYTVTLSIFPGVLAEDVASASLSSWYPVALIAVFNAADCAGKWLPAAPAFRIRSARKIGAAAAARTLFIPAFHLAATRGGGPAVVGLLAALLGVSNGHLTSVAMMAAPEAVPPGAASLCGNLMVLSLILGLSLGAACGFLWLLV